MKSVVMREKKKDNKEKEKLFSLSHLSQAFKHYLDLIDPTGHSACDWHTPGLFGSLIIYITVPLRILLTVISKSFLGFPLKMY